MGKEKYSDNQFFINKVPYSIIDVIENISVVDSFVKVNKIGTGNGEARLYIGSQKSYDFDKFFESYRGKDNCIFLKKDFIKYMGEAKFEYENQEQGYREDISKNWTTFYDEAQDLKDEIMLFTIESANGEEDSSRYYIRSHDEIFREFFRKIALPTITYVSIYKISDSVGKIYFYFYISLDYEYNPVNHPEKIRLEEKKINQEPGLNKNEKMQLVRSRIGQGKYKEGLLEEMPECLITRVNDERVLIGSHIKPWSLSDDTEKIDHYNGLTLTPTYDKLFDQGFISFEDDGKILISPYISPLNIKKLNLAKDRVFSIPNIEKRKTYLKYHRDYIFKK